MKKEEKKKKKERKKCALQGWKLKKWRAPYYFIQEIKHGAKIAERVEIPSHGSTGVAQ